MKLDLTKSIKGYSKTPKEKFFRIFWLICWNTVRFLPKQLSPIKVLVLRIFGAKIGEKVLIDFGVKIWIPQNLVLIDGYVALGRNVEIYNYAKVIIGPMSIISQYSYLITGTHDYSDPIMPLIWSPITIDSEVWVAAGVWIFPGVTIGKGTVVAARSNVTKSLNAWKVCAGSPCKELKNRIIS